SPACALPSWSEKPLYRLIPRHQEQGVSPRAEPQRAVAGAAPFSGLALAEPWVKATALTTVAPAPETTVARAIDHFSAQRRLVRPRAGHLVRVAARWVEVIRRCWGCVAAVARLARVDVSPRVRLVWLVALPSGVEVLVPRVLSPWVLVTYERV